MAFSPALMRSRLPSSMRILRRSSTSALRAACSPIWRSKFLKSLSRGKTMDSNFMGVLSSIL